MAGAESGDRTIRFGDDVVAVVERQWRTSAPLPYRRTYLLRPGQRWSDAPATEGQFEHYVDLDGEVMPVGAAIARDLVADGADWAYFTEMWAGRFVVLDANLVCQPLDGRPGELIAELRVANGGGLGGLPDVIGEQPDGCILMREAKTPKSGDRLRPNQHDFARAARRLYGDRLDLAVVEWAIDER